jgi:hypothetical protein
MAAIEPMRRLICKAVGTTTCLPLLLATAAFLAIAPLVNAEVAKHGTLSVSFTGGFSPRTLPRHGTAPIAVTIGGQVHSTDPSGPPALKKITIAFNRYGQLQYRGLPVCRLNHIEPATTAKALAECRSSLIGEGQFSANVRFPEQSPFPSQGKALFFNGRLRGEPVIFAQVYGRHPLPTSFVLSFHVRSVSHGTFGTILEASLPSSSGEWGFVTGLSMKLSRRYSFHGKPRSYLAAGCPLPSGVPRAAFRAIRTSFAFAGGITLSTTLSGECNAR